MLSCRRSIRWSLLVPVLALFACDTARTAAAPAAGRAAIREGFAAVFGAVRCTQVVAHVQGGPGVAAAQRMITQLGDLLRASLSGGARQTVPLESEIALLERYVEIERFRFEDRLRVEFDVDPDARAAHVPALLAGTPQTGWTYGSGT